MIGVQIFLAIGSKDSALRHGLGATIHGRKQFCRCFTMDAGPNVKILVQQVTEAIRDRFMTEFDFQLWWLILARRLIQLMTYSEGCPYNGPAFRAFDLAPELNFGIIRVSTPANSFLAGEYAVWPQTNRLCSSQLASIYCRAGISPLARRGLLSPPARPRRLAL